MRSIKFLFFVLAITTSVPGAVQTNAAPFAQVTYWRKAFDQNAFADLARKIEQQMSADAPWRAVVLQATNGCYEWGFYAALYQSRALLAVRQPDAAYRALATATAYRPLSELLGALLAAQGAACGAK